jgi:hypothetical protein
MAKIFGTETQQTISDWANATFGEVKSTRSILTRANCEMAELVHAVECGAPTEKIAAEIADVIIVLCRYSMVFGPHNSGGCSTLLIADDMLNSARRTPEGISRDSYVHRVVWSLAAFAEDRGIDLSATIDAKMKINRGRKWISKGPGHGQHVAAPPAFLLPFVSVDEIMTALGVDNDPTRCGSERSQENAIRAAKKLKASQQQLRRELTISREHADKLADMLNGEGGARAQIAALKTLLRNTGFAASLLSPVVTYTDDGRAMFAQAIAEAVEVAPNYAGPVTVTCPAIGLSLSERETLAAKARAAMPGEWSLEDWNEDDGPNKTTLQGRLPPERESERRRDMHKSDHRNGFVGRVVNIEEMDSADAAYLVAVQPRVVLALLAQIGEPQGLSDDERETLRLAREYRAACDAVQIAWSNLITGAVGYDGLKANGVPYLAAQKHAGERHRALIAHVSGGVLEVGQ